jgi:Domain of unknown function (DUF3883)
MVLSPGVAARCVNVLRIVHENPLPFERLRHELPRDSRYGNDDVLKLSQELGWIRVNDVGLVVVAPAGCRLLAMDVSGPARLRRTVLDYVEGVRPPWTKLALDGRARTLRFAPVGLVQLISEAYLAEGYDDEVVEFWDRLAAIARGQTNIHLTQIGRRGERLTLDYERRRTGVDPIWCSIESNADGYDVLSVVSREDLGQKQIEVKTSTSGLSGAVHLTRNEWDMTETMLHHEFYLWDIVRHSSPQLAIVSRLEMSSHVPSDNGRGCWREVEIPFSEFADRFARVAL